MVTDVENLTLSLKRDLDRLLQEASHPERKGMDTFDWHLNKVEEKIDAYLKLNPKMDLEKRQSLIDLPDKLADLAEIHQEIADIDDRYIDIELNDDQRKAVQATLRQFQDDFINARNDIENTILVLFPKLV